MSSRWGEESGGEPAASGLFRGMSRARVVDSHTGGEPTRVVIEGGPDLGTGSLEARRERFRTEFDDFRTATLLEPRGSDVLVGAVLTPPSDPDSGAVAGVIFFNNVGYLGMCGHGMIGVVTTLAALGRIGPGWHRLETPVGIVPVLWDESQRVTIRNVPSYRYRRAESVTVPGHGVVRGDIAWGGNWFFLVPPSEHRKALTLANVDALTEFSWKIRQALEHNGVTGYDHGLIDHVELMGPPALPGNSARNFVLCPGKAYDRSPCGTGTSAKLACAWADGILEPGQIWRQESIVGSVFEGWVEPLPDPDSYPNRGAGAGSGMGLELDLGGIAPEADGAVVIPILRGRAFLTAVADLVFDPQDPFRTGIRV